MFTEEQLTDIRDVLSRVNVNKICRSKRINGKPIRSATVWEVLRGVKKSPEHIKMLKTVVATARKQLHAIEKEIQSL